MKKYIKDWVRVTPEMRKNFGPFPQWMLPHLDAGKTEKIIDSEWIDVKTPKGNIPVYDYDYIVLGVNGEFYTFKPAVFAETCVTVSEDIAIENNFRYHSPKEGQPQKYEQIRAMAKELAYAINYLCPSSRERSLAMTKLEECVMWANAAIARNG